MMEWYDVPPQRAVLAEGHKGKNIPAHLQKALLREFSSLKSGCNYTNQTKRRLLLLSLNQNIWLRHFTPVNLLNPNLMNS